MKKSLDDEVSEISSTKHPNALIDVSQPINYHLTTEDIMEFGSLIAKGFSYAAKSMYRNSFLEEAYCKLSDTFYRITGW